MRERVRESNDIVKNARRRSEQGVGLNGEALFQWYYWKKGKKKRK